MEDNVSINYSNISKFLIVSVSIHKLLKIAANKLDYHNLWYAKYTDATELKN